MNKQSIKTLVVLVAIVALILVASVVVSSINIVELLKQIHGS